MSKRESGSSAMTPTGDVEQQLVSALSASGESRWLMVDVGSMAVSNSAKDVLATSAPVGSCVAVCLWEPHAQVSGLLHFLWPDSKLNPDEARDRPATFADTGLLLLFDEATRFGANKARCKVWLVGGAPIPDREGAEKWAKRNLLAARSALWKAGILLNGEEVGGTKARRAMLSVNDGQLFVKIEEVEDK